MGACRPRWPRRQRWKMGERSCCVFVRARWWFHIERRTERSLKALCGNHAELLVLNGCSRSLTEQCGTLQRTPLWWWLTQDLSNKHSPTLCPTEKWDRRQRKEMFHLVRRVRFKMQVRKKKKEAVRLWVGVAAVVDVEHSDRLPGRSHLNETTNGNAPEKKHHLSAFCPDASQTVHNHWDPVREKVKTKSKAFRDDSRVGMKGILHFVRRH